jgi:aconitate hydratase
MVPFVLNGKADFKDDDYIFVPNIKKVLDGDMSEISAYVIGDEVKSLSLAIEPLTDEEKEIIRCGSLINYNRKRKAVQTK